MKNLVLLALFGLIGLMSMSVTMADVGPVGRGTSFTGAGALQAGSGEKWFINVVNQTTAFADGDVATIDFGNDDGYSVSSSTTAGAVPMCIMDEACAAGATCRCQTYGLKTNVNFDVTGAESSAGGLVFISETTAGSVQATAPGSIAGLDTPIGMFYDGVSATGDAEIFIKLR